MEKIFWEKNRSEVGNEELMAYILAKIKPFEWVRRIMFDKKKVYRFPPIFCWRFCDANEEIYVRLKYCVEEFEGKIKWVMYKGDGSKYFQSTRNYTIEPRLFYELRKTVGNTELSKVIELHHREECLKAIDDVEPLCRHIEETFGVLDSRPHLPILPFSK